MGRRRRLVLMVGGVVGLVLAVIAPSFACAPVAEITSDRAVVRPGSQVLLAGRNFRSEAGPIEISLSDGTTKGVALTSVGATFSFRVGVTVPVDTPPSTDPYFFVAEQRDLAGALILRASDEIFVQPGAGSPTPSRGYRMVASDGGIFAFGDAGFFGSMGGRPLHRPIVGMASTPSGNGYWEVASDGGIFAFGDAGYFGSMGGRPLARPIVAMASTPSGQGYWLVASDGGIFAFGDAGYFGSTGALPLVSPIVGMARTTSGQGYWMVSVDGGVFAFGDAPFLGSLTGVAGQAPVVGIAASPAVGYWIADAAGGVANIGDLWTAEDPFNGVRPTRPIVGIAATGVAPAHWLAATDGGVFALRGAPFLGSVGGLPLVRPVVGLAATRG